MEIKNADSNLLINELNSTIGTYTISLKLSKRILHSVLSMSFLQKRITHLQSVFGVENKSMSAFNSILRHLLNIHRIEVPTVRFRRAVGSREKREVRRVEQRRQGYLEGHDIRHLSFHSPLSTLILILTPLHN